MSIPKNIRNIQVILAKRPKGMADRNTWAIKTADVRSLNDNELLISNEYVSLDPAMRGWISAGKSYIEPVQIGDVMRAGTIGKVVASKNPGFQEGEIVTGWTGVQQFAISDGNGLVKVKDPEIPLPKYLGVLGMPGFTAYFGLLDIGRPKGGETIVVSGAAGAVGSVVGQIAKIKSCRAVGIAGGPVKCKYVVDELGFDACIDYKNDNLRKALKEYCPKGVDIYFDNVGGETLDQVLTRINRNARIPICGAISQYNNTEGIAGPSNYLSLLVNRARMEGFIVFDYAKNYGTASKELAEWVKQGRLKSREHIEEGIENFPQIFNKLFTGDKLGKLVLKIG